MADPKPEDSYFESDGLINQENLCKSEREADDVIDHLLKSAILPVLLSTSFVHEIMARKWVYHGIYLEHFPTIYYRVLLDDYFLQDIGLYQMLICCGASIQSKEENQDIVN